MLKTLRKENRLNFNFDRYKNMSFSLQKNKTSRFGFFPTIKPSHRINISITWAQSFQKIFVGTLSLEYGS